MARNIAAGLLLASLDVVGWEGEEWALESGDDDEPLAWAEPDAPRVPFAWLRAIGRDRSAAIATYQDDDRFGLCFTLAGEPVLPTVADRSLRPRRDIALATGRIHTVEVAYDTAAEGGAWPGLLSEVLLHTDDGSTLLVAAEAYARDEWHRHDESVVALPRPAAADELEWLPPRRPWRAQ